MAFSGAPFGMIQPSYATSPPPSMGFGFPTPGAGFPSNPPQWATELINDVKMIKEKLHSIDKIEKSISSINIKMTDIESKMKSFGTRITETEKCCEYLSKDNDSIHRELKDTRSDLKNIKKDFNFVESQSTQICGVQEKLEQQVINLEMQSLQNNLLFYGFPEEPDENCGNLIKELCRDTLKLSDAETFGFEKPPYRLGKRSPGKTRPILARFIHTHQRERVRSASFDQADDLRDVARGIGIQLPRAVRDARRPLYPKMEEAKKAGKSVKFIGTKLFINNVEYKPSSDY
jgi:archaellum component FlaC